jgi:hypothetical protein
MISWIALLNGDNGLLVAGYRRNLPGSDPRRAELVNYNIETGGQFWHTYIFDTVSIDAVLYDIDQDSFGNIYGFGAYSEYPEEYDSNKMFIAKIAPDNGEVLWTHIFRDEFWALKGKVLNDRVRTYGGKSLVPIGYKERIIDSDYEGNILTSSDLIDIEYGPGIFQQYFFFDNEGHLIMFGYKIRKFGVSEEPVWDFDFAQGQPNMIGQAMTAVSDGEGNIFATGYLRDTVALLKYTQTVKLSPTGELIWSKTDKFSAETDLERGRNIEISGHHVLVCSSIWYYENNNPEKVDYRLLLYSNEDGNIQYDTLIDANVFDISYDVHYDKGHFYLLGRSYDPWGSAESYKYKLFKFGVEEPVNATGNVQEKKQVEIYPNPANHTAMLKEPTDMPFDRFSLSNEVGEVLFFEAFKTSAKVLNLQGMQPGVYFLHFIGEGVRHTEKLILSGKK